MAFFPLPNPIMATCCCDTKKVFFFCRKHCSRLAKKPSRNMQRFPARKRGVQYSKKNFPPLLWRRHWRRTVVKKTAILFSSLPSKKILSQSSASPAAVKQKRGFRRRRRRRGKSVWELCCISYLHYLPSPSNSHKWARVESRREKEKWRGKGVKCVCMGIARR